MSWFNILKTPYTQKGEYYHNLELEDIPGLEAIFRDPGFPLEEIWRRHDFTFYKRKTNAFIPSLGKRDDAIGYCAIYNMETKSLIAWEGEVGKWQPMLINHWNGDVDALKHGTGRRRYSLQPNQLGIVAIETASQQLYSVDVPKDSELAPDTILSSQELTNGEAAALGILAHHAKGKRDRNSRIKLFQEFGIGPLEKNTDSPTILSLVKKGLMEMDANHPMRSLRNYPMITMKGKKEAHVVDVSRTIFMNDFRKIVREDPKGIFEGTEKNV